MKYLKIRMLQAGLLATAVFLLFAAYREPNLEEALPPPQAASAASDSFLTALLGSYPQYFSTILQQRDQYRLQIIYTQINRNSANQPLFTDYTFNVNPSNYFYPASTVKMPLAALALQRIRELRIKGLDPGSTMITDAAYSGQEAVFNDPNTATGRPTVAQYIKKIFLVSDNDAYNRLYEFLGQDYINTRLHQMGYDSVQIVHRLERYLTEDENRHTNPVRFYDGSGKLLYQQAARFNEKPYQRRSDWLGRAHYQGNTLVQSPMDFSRKNRIPLPDLHRILRSLLFPQSVPPRQRFAITPADHRLLLKYMSQYPGETYYPNYPEPDYWDAFGKFIYWGAEKGKLPRNFRIFNKIGDAYGFIIDVAYVVDFENKVEFMLSASMYCNSDGILNDGEYDYDAVGFPFFRNLGRVVYEYEKKRKRRYIPELSTFRMTYDK